MPNAKEIAGRRAAELVEDGMLLGLGTGSTVHFTLIRLAERVRDERLRLRGVPTSLDTDRKARELGIPLVALDDVNVIDLTIDGADEIDGDFNMIKGGGGALLREKVIASISRREAIVVGAGKRVERLGSTFALPVEIVPFARAPVSRALTSLGCTPLVRGGAERPFATDNGNWILDCRFPDGIRAPAVLERRIAQIPGVVDSGLFIGLAQILVIGHDDGRCEVVHKTS
ncbi:MAG: ribose-5-phosphate isomerase RpiA [Planctomycetota bacterium]